jgi:hypothetical protein
MRMNYLDPLVRDNISDFQCQQPDDLQLLDQG